MIKYIVYYVDDFGKKHIAFAKTMKEIKNYQKRFIKVSYEVF